jgi:hypothetical protein
MDERAALIDLEVFGKLATVQRLRQTGTIAVVRSE